MGGRNQRITTVEEGEAEGFVELYCTVLLEDRSQLIRTS